MVHHGLFYGGGDLGFSEQIDEPDDFFELMGDIEFRFGHGFQIVFCFFSHAQNRITMF